MTLAFHPGTPLILHHENYPQQPVPDDAAGRGDVATGGALANGPLVEKVRACQETDSQVELCNSDGSSRENSANCFVF